MNNLMNKRQYLESLREYLSFELPERLVKKNLDFYSDYFAEQTKEGKSVTEIIEELGDPQLIARSCIEAEKAGPDGIPDNSDDYSFEQEIYAERTGNRGYDSSTDRESNSGTYYRTNQTQQTQQNTQAGPFKGAGCLLTALIVLGLISLVVAFFSTEIGSVIFTILIVIGLFKVIGRIFRR